MNNRTRTLFLAIASAGCVSLLANGADSRHGAPARYRARLVAQNCRLSDGKKIASPQQVYYLALDEGRPALIELDAMQDGVVVRNAWSDEEGQQFFVWITGGPGYKFVFPRDAALKPQRVVYAQGGYEAAQDAEGKYRPVGRPAGSCDLVSAEPPALPPPSKSGNETSSW